MGTYYFFQASRMTDFNEEGVHDRIVMGHEEGDRDDVLLSITWEKRHGIPLESPVVAFIANYWRFLEHLDKIGFVEAFFPRYPDSAILLPFRPSQVSKFLQGGIKRSNLVPFTAFEDRSDHKRE